jgi:hypothetical protein
VITVSLCFDLADKVDLDRLEPVILEAGRRAMAEALRAACREYEARVTECPFCGDARMQGEGSDSRVVLTSFGRVAIAMRQLKCEGCGLRFRPAEPFLACLEGANVSGKLRKAAVLAGSSWPYQTAARVLAELCGACISPEKVRQLTVQAGAREAKAELELARGAVSPTAERVRKERDRSLWRRGEKEEQGAELLLVGLDGGWVPSRDQRGGMEGKVGVLATEIEDVGKGRHRLTKRKYVATFGSADGVGLLAYRAAEELGGVGAAEQRVLADGAPWIKTQAEEHFPGALCILDWPHPERAIHKAIRAAKPGPEHKELRRELHRTIPERLWCGDADGAIALLVSLRPSDGRQPVKVLEETISYLDNQRAWLHDYQALKDEGCPIGSGLVERAVDLVINRRMKKRGMRWKRANADAVVSLRAETINQEWEDACASRAA